MTKPQAAGLLGGLTLTAVLLLSSLGSASQGVFRNDFLRQLRGACVENAEYVGACLLAVDALEGTNKPDDLVADISKAIGKLLGVRGNTSCVDCVSAVSILETQVAENGTIENIQDVLREACVAEFRHAGDQAQCIAAIDQHVPVLLNQITSDAPPLIVCRELKSCPVP